MTKSYRTDGRESPILAESDADGNSDKSRCKYGELVILGWVLWCHYINYLLHTLLTFSFGHLDRLQSLQWRAFRVTKVKARWCCSEGKRNRAKWTFRNSMSCPWFFSHIFIKEPSTFHHYNIQIINYVINSRWF